MQNMQYIDFCIFCIQNCTFHSIFFAYSNHIVYIFAYFTCNCIFFAYLCIFLRDPFQLALLLAVSVPFSKHYNNRFVCTLHCSQAHADLPGYGDPGAQPRPAYTPAPPGHSPASTAAAAAPSVSASTAAALLLLLWQDKVTILAEYTCISNI